MREALALVMFCALLGAFYCALAGAVFGESAFGLHPMVAALGAVFCFAVGYLAAAFLERLE